MSATKTRELDPDLEAEQFVGRPATRELVPSDPQLSGRWHKHDYPSVYARWNYHPEYEVHLIRDSHGRYIVGDRVGIFAPGQLVLVGPNLPHDWISDTREHQCGRDVVFQFLGSWLDECRSLLPEIADLQPLLLRAARGIQFGGAAASRGAAELEAIGSSRGVERLQHIFALFETMAAASESEYELLSNADVPWDIDPQAEAVIGATIGYIFANLTDDVRLSVAARNANMSEAAFSKYFKRASGQTFSDMVRRLRLAHARRLLRQTSDSVALIAQEVGYANLSNFNRQFLAEHGVTPSRYRRGGES